MGLALVFEARIGSRTIEGVDFLRLNSLGLVDDFRVSRRGRVVSLRNAPSPAATSSLAIAEHLVNLVLDRQTTT